MNVAFNPFVCLDLGWWILVEAPKQYDVVIKRTIGDSGAIIQWHCHTGGTFPALLRCVNNTAVFVLPYPPRFKRALDHYLA